MERRGRKGGEEGGGREGDRDMKEGGEGGKVRGGVERNERRERG